MWYVTCKRDPKPNLNTQPQSPYINIFPESEASSFTPVLASLFSLSQLQDLCFGKAPIMAEQSESQKTPVLAIVDLLSVDCPTKKCRQLNAALMFVSAMEGEGKLHAEEGVKVLSSSNGLVSLNVL